MIVYLDVLIFLDFIVNVLCLVFIQRLFNDKVLIIRNILTSLIFSLSIILCIYSNLILLLMKILGGVFISYFGLSKNIKIKKVIQISLFYALNFSLVGVLSTFSVNTWYLLIFSLIAIFGLFILNNFRIYFINLFKDEYNVILDDFKLPCFVDTGNTSTYNGIPVVFINNKYDLICDTTIPITTIGGTIYVKGVLKQITLKTKTKETKLNCYVSCANISYECLIGSNLIY